MKTEQLILIGAVAFAGLLVAQKTGILKKAGVSSGKPYSGSFLSDTPFFQTSEEQGYDPSNPGNYVFVEDLAKGQADQDWLYTPSRFEQSTWGRPFYETIWYPTGG